MSKKLILIVLVAAPDVVLAVDHAKAKPLALFVQFQSDVLVKPTIDVFVSLMGSSDTVPGFVLDENDVKVKGWKLSV
jgi:hypothetical protein